MTRKPSYEELEKRVKQLKKEVVEQKQAEEALRESELKFRGLFDLYPQAIAITEVETGRLIDVNDMFCNLTIYNEKEILGRTTTELGFYSKEDRNRFMGKLQPSGEIHGFEMDFKAKDGSIITSMMFARHIQVKGKAFIITAFLDMTERKRLESQLLHAQKMEAVGALAGGIAHDFNNLLMGMQGYDSLMLMDIDPTHPHYERLKGIEQLIQSGANLTRQLLGFARGGKYEVKITDLNKIVRKSTSMFARTKKEITIRRKYQKDIWPIEADQSQIEQVFLNLYVNAWQAMPGGGELYLETQNVILDEWYTKPYHIEPGMYVKISVTDTGVGMDEETRQKIFEPFFSTKKIGEGTGLGLASVYGIVKNHGGYINTYSEVGKGTTFNVYLPVSEMETGDQRLEADEQLIHYGHEAVLLVDDEKIVLEVAGGMLTSLGYTVIAATNGKDAIEAYEKERDTIDMVILDMIMPGLSGRETCNRLKAIDPAVKILLSSGYSIDGQATEILKRGCNGFIQKPFDMRRLSRKIREILNV
ncbi:MAG: response regulator [Deltaproteobacteria bacterium]|nr:response regulator [Deltaproteobacteria bacterium]